MTIDPNKLPSSPVSDVVMQMESTNEFGEKIRTHDPKVHPNTKIPVNLLFSKTTKNTVLFNGEYMEIYIPTSDLDRNTIIDGQNIKTFGIFEMHIWNRPGVDYSTAEPDFITRYMNPAQIETCPSVISKKTTSLKGETPRQYLVLGYQRNDAFIKNTTVIRSGKMLGDFVDTIFKGFINTAVVRYDEMIDLILESCYINGIDFGVNITSLEINIAAQARCKDDMSTPYRIQVNKTGKVSMHDMKFIKLTQIPHIASTFTSFAFQDIDYAITTSAKRHRNKEKEKISDVEEIMKY